jgi:pimeloyl-ACP methyl ester carboxylesterase
MDGFVKANGVRLQYLDWGGVGPDLILIHGAADNPHVFDDLAPAFTDCFHVVAYARRGCGRSEARSPYDTATLTQDLCGLMDALGVGQANLVGWSLGGNEITAFAGTHPARVGRIVYLDGAYDWADPDFVEAFKAYPRDVLDPPASVMASLGAYLSYKKAVDYAALDDLRRVETYLRETVEIQPDGSLRPRIEKATMDSIIYTLLNDRRDYTRVRSPALAIYADSFFDMQYRNPKWLDEARTWEQRHMAPFRQKSIDRIRRELVNAEIVNVPGAHDSFVFTSRAIVIATMRRFLNETKSIELIQ